MPKDVNICVKYAAMTRVVHFCVNYAAVLNPKKEKYLNMQMHTMSPFIAEGDVDFY